jgi:anti-sigma regulatory factor (Ser/Thr protein kinase)
MPAAAQLGSPSRNSISIPGGDAAPDRARRHTLAQLDGGVSDLRASDAAVIVSELVTNSVVHANVGRHQDLLLELTRVDNYLRIAVTDPGSELEPRLLPADPARAGGFGLRLVDHLSSAWGVTRDAAGTTRVWCDLRLDGGPTS